jgi:septal ring factor EnvC (AmiA/AmiB activator)
MDVKKKIDQIEKELLSIDKSQNMISKKIDKIEKLTNQIGTRQLDDMVSALKRMCYRISVITDEKWEVKISPDFPDEHQKLNNHPLKEVEINDFIGGKDLESYQKIH